MFEVNDQIYKTKYVFPDHSCICGDEEYVLISKKNWRVNNG